MDLTDVEQPERLELSSGDLAEKRREELLRLFPEVRTEGGNIDFDRLELALGEAVDTGPERYGLTWPGKADCFKTIQAPSMGTLRPVPEESVNWDTTENVIIEGDNLEVLKLLQKSYLGKVKMIYIDPPYNTGNDFIYPDDYSESLQTYLEYTGQVDAEGKKFSTNVETDGRFHSKWLNMMYPRLYLARNLLREDGVIFITIGESEVANLRRLCDEIFGEGSFLACAVWQKRTSPDARAALGSAHDYILCYVRTPSDKKSPLNPIPLSAERRASFSNPDNDPRGDWASVDLTGQTGHATPAQFFEVETPSGRRYGPPPGRCWALTQKRFNELVAGGRVWFGANGDSRPRLKQYLSETTGMSSWTWWPNSEVGHNQEATKELAELFGQAGVFDNPKPVRLMRRMLELATRPEGSEIVLDFFAGSGTMGEAIARLNEEDGGSRRFILAQLPEPTDIAEFPDIASIVRERVRRTYQVLTDRITNSTPTAGFRSFALAASNFAPWDGLLNGREGQLENQLQVHLDNLLPGRTDVDVLYEVLLKSGFPLSTGIEKREIEEATVYLVDGGVLTICFAEKPSVELVRAIAAQQPERVVLLERGFEGNDQLKANAVQIFRTAGVTSFKTV